MSNIIDTPLGPLEVGTVLRVIADTRPEETHGHANGNLVIFARNDNDGLPCAAFERDRDSGQDFRSTNQNRNPERGRGIYFQWADVEIYNPEPQTLLEATRAVVAALEALEAAQAAVGTEETRHAEAVAAETARHDAVVQNNAAALKEAGDAAADAQEALQKFLAQK